MSSCFRIDVDGRPVDAAQVERATQFGNGGRSARLDFPIVIPEGRSELTVFVEAVGKRGEFSRPHRLTLHYDPPQRELYLLAIGVGDYADDRLDLPLVAKDVAAISATFEAQKGSFYKDVHVLRLVDAEASNGALLRARDEFLMRAGPEDTIVVFAAGHGVRTETNEYFLLTRTCTAANPYDGVPRATLESLVDFARLRAPRRVLLLDTCHAGEAMNGAEGFRGDRGAAALFSQEEVDARVSRDRGGIYVLAASLTDEVAREQAGNGYFTRAIVDGLRGAADDAGDRDGLVEIAELARYAESAVLERSAGRQRPTMPTVKGGENFALARRAAR